MSKIKFFIIIAVTYSSKKYDKKILKKELPYTIGGGIGQSRVLMLLLGKKHVASVQASSWEQKTIDELKDLNIL